MYDLLITNGLIIDGTGSALYRTDVAVSQGHIVAIGSLPGTARYSYPTGVAHVAVNGVFVLENGAFTGRTPGKVIRSFAD